MRKPFLLSATGLAALGLAVMCGFALAQGSGSSRSTTSRPARPQTTKEFADSLWRFIVRPQAPYTTWEILPIRKNVVSGTEGDRPHGPTPKVYSKPELVQDLRDLSALPFGSILVIEDYSPDGKTRNSISIMYRVKGTDPEHNDWYWMRYLPNGSLATIDGNPVGKPMAGKVKSCIDCHDKAGGKDLVFTNDAAE